MQRLTNLFAAAAALFAVADASAQSIQLADGRVLLASVEQADGEGLRVCRAAPGRLACSAGGRGRGSTSTRADL